jgi:hypothetical protein
LKLLENPYFIEVYEELESCLMNFVEGADGLPQYWIFSDRKVFCCSISGKCSC